MWKSFRKTGLFATISSIVRTKMQTEMENQDPDVKFTLEALVGSLTTLSGRRPLARRSENPSQSRTERGQFQVRLAHTSKNPSRQHHTRSPSRYHVRGPVIRPVRRSSGRKPARSAKQRISSTSIHSESDSQGAIIAVTLHIGSYFRLSVCQQDPEDEGSTRDLFRVVQKGHFFLLMAQSFSVSPRVTLQIRSFGYVLLFRFGTTPPLPLPPAPHPEKVSIIFYFLGARALNPKP